MPVQFDPLAIQDRSTGVAPRDPHSLSNMRLLSKKKVVMVAPTFPIKPDTLDGGTQSATYYLCSSLSEEENIALTVVRPNTHKEAPKEIEYNGLRVFTLSKPRWQSEMYYLFYGMKRQLEGFLREKTYDIIHVQGNPLLVLRSIRNTILTVHGISERDTLYNSSRKLVFVKYLFLKITHGRARRNVKNVIAISPYTRNYLSPAQRIWDIPNPVGNLFFEVKRDPIPFRIFTASHCTPLKNTTTLIGAFSHFTKSFPQAELRIAGSHQNSSYGEKCRRLARKLGIDNKVTFLGLLRQKELLAELSHASLFALCSLQENAPMSIAEAQCSGVPVLASRVGGIPWMIKHSKTGYLVDPHDESAIAEALKNAFIGGKLYNIGKASKKEAENAYRQSVITMRTIQCYDEVIHSS